MKLLSSRSVAGPKEKITSACRDTKGDRQVLETSKDADVPSKFSSPRQEKVTDLIAWHRAAPSSLTKLTFPGVALMLLPVHTTSEPSMGFIDAQPHPKPEDRR